MQKSFSVRACGVIGSRARLRIWCRETCRFESYQAHIVKMDLINTRLLNPFYFIILHKPCRPTSRTKDLTSGNITQSMLCLAYPLILGNLLQQGYNIADTLIIGQTLGANALAAVGSSYTLMVFITSIFIGLCMGCSALFSMRYGAKDYELLKRTQTAALLITGIATFLIFAFAISCIRPIIQWLQTPEELQEMTYDYLKITFIGIWFVYLYNYYAYLLRALGNSFTPLVYLAISVVLNIVLDLLFILRLGYGIAGAATATVLSQAVSAIGLWLYCWRKIPETRLTCKDFKISRPLVRQVFSYVSLTCIQQSVMNFGILMVQGLVNSFGTSVMAAFTAAVKIDSFAYMPVQDFGNAFSTFTAQNYGAGKKERILQGFKKAFWMTTLFCLLLSALIFLTAPWLMQIFISSDEKEIIRIGVEYLRVEGSFYLGIGYLFLWYGFYRAICKPHLSIILTILSLGTRVALAYFLASIPSIGVHGIWWSIPIGWALADIYGQVYYWKKKQSLLAPPIVSQ